MSSKYSGYWVWRTEKSQVCWGEKRSATFLDKSCVWISCTRRLRGKPPTPWSDQGKTLLPSPIRQEKLSQEIWKAFKMAHQVVEILTLEVYVKRSETLLVSGLYHLNPRLSETIFNQKSLPPSIPIHNFSVQQVNSIGWRIFHVKLFIISLSFFFASGGYPFLLSAMLCSTSINSTLLKNQDYSSGWFLR